MTTVNGKEEHQPFPLRSPGFIQSYAGSLASSGYLLEYDGYWVCCTLDNIRTIGNASSGAAIAQSWTYLLFEFLWTNYSNTRCPIYSSSGSVSSRGTTALADWNSNKRLSLPDFRGRAIVGAGTGSNPDALTARTIGSTFGAETHTLSLSEIPGHTHPLRINGGLVYSLATSGVGGNTVNNDSGFSAGGSQWLTDTIGGGASHNNLQPSFAQHFIVSAGAR